MIALPTVGPVELVPLNEIVPCGTNPRLHTPENVEKIARSITTFGWTVPILLDAEANIIAGHGRFLAAQKLGLDSVPVLRITHLTPELVKAYRIADNQLTLDSEWDSELLRSALVELRDLSIDLTITGFPSDELADLLSGTNTDNGPVERQLTQQEEQAMDDAWQRLVSDWDDQIERAKIAPPISTSYTPGALAVRYLRALFFNETIPQPYTLAYTPNRFYIAGAQKAFPDAVKKARTRQDVRKALRWFLQDTPSFDRIMVTLVPLHSHRIPGDFPSDIAKALINEFCPRGGSVLDPCHGWGGRALGFLLSDAGEYHGFDPCLQTSEGVQRMLDELMPLTPWRPKLPTLECRPFEQAELMPNAYDFALTSPPYYDVEKYEGEETCWRVYGTFDQWVEGFYRPLIANVWIALRNGATFALQVGSQTYPLAQLAEQIALEHGGWEYCGQRDTGMVNNLMDTEREAGESIVLLRKRMVGFKPRGRTLMEVLTNGEEGSDEVGPDSAAEAD